MFGRSGASVVGIARLRIPALAQLLLQSSHLPLQAFDAIERIVEAGGLHRLQEGPDGRERRGEISPAPGPAWFAVCVIRGSSENDVRRRAESFGLDSRQAAIDRQVDAGDVAA